MKLEDIITLNIPWDILTNLVECPYEPVAEPGRRDSAVHAEDLAVDDGGDGHHVEYL